MQSHFNTNFAPSYNDYVMAHLWFSSHSFNGRDHIFTVNSWDWRILGS